MPDRLWLAELGAAVVPPLVTPLLVWTALALLVEAVLRRAASVPAASALAVRRGVLFSLPLALVGPLASDLWAVPVSTVVTGGGAPFPLPEIAVGPALQPVGAAWTAWTAWGLAVVAVATVAGLAAVRFGVAVRRLARLRRTATPASEATLALARALSAQAGLRSVPQVGTGPAGSAPFTLGTRRPLVVVPADLDGGALRLALAHELAHVRRRDFAWTLAERAVVALCAAHPLVHLVARGAALDRECIADADVVAARPAERRAYADLLLRFAASPPPALAIGAGGLSPLKHRITAMTRLSSPRALRRARLAGRALAALVVTFTLGVGAAGASPSTDGFELVRPTVTINGVASEFSGTLRAESFGAFSVEAAGYGRVLFSTAPFAGARAEGRLNSTMLLAAEPGQVVVVTSQGDVVTPSRRQTLYVRFDLETGAHAPAPGFEVRLTLAADVSSLAADATPRPRSALEALPDTTMPELIGGLAALQQAIVYPRIQREAGIEGRTFVQFVVSEAGTPRSVQVVRSAGDPALDASAVAAVEAARFRPGTVEGRPVPVRFAIPITFRLGDAPPAQPPMPNGVDTMPELIGGLEALQQAVVYPEVQRRAGIEGTAFVRFVVSPSGAVQDAEVARGTGDEALDAAAVAAVESVTFRPGTKGGRAVAVEFVVPVRFVLPDADGR